ncbi:restriction endonuclease [Candidatus Bipolaricaulota bacterium]
MVNRALFPSGIATGLSLNQYRQKLRPLLTEELVRLHWQDRGRGHFWRAGTIQPESRDRSPASGPDRAGQAVPKVWGSRPTAASLLDLSPRAFESLVADIWEAMGYSTRVTQRSRDGGIDVLASRAGKTVAIQAKRYKETSVGVQEIRQYASLALRDGIDRVVVVTTSTFTGPARAEAKSLEVELIDGRALSKLLQQYGPELPAAATTSSPGETSSLRKSGETANSNPGCLIAVGAVLFVMGAVSLGDRAGISMLLVGLGVAGWGLMQLGKRA